MGNEEQLKILNDKVLQLIAKFSFLQKENISLKKQLDKKINELKEKDHELEMLQQKIDGAKLGSAVWNDDDKKALQKRVDIYLKEIDKCLQLLNQ